MANYNVGDVGKEMGAVPFGTLISGMAKGIAEGQWELDKSSIRVAELMSGSALVRNLDTGELIMKAGTNEPQKVDTRVYFGYDFERKDAAAKVADGEAGVKDGKIQKINVVNGGDFYSFEPEVEIIGKGSGATAKATVKDGKVTAITVTAQGSGYDQETSVSLIGGGGKRVAQQVSMMELGFTPNFYQFVDTIIEIKIVVTMTQSNDEVRNEASKEDQTSQQDYSVRASGGWWHRPYSASYNSKSTTAKTKTVDAAYTNKYNYSVEGSSMVRTKIVPVPPPAILEERIRQVMETEEMIRNERLGKK